MFNFGFFFVYFFCVFEFLVVILVEVKFFNLFKGFVDFLRLFKIKS